MNQLVVMPRAPMATWAALGRNGICDPIRGAKQRRWPAAVVLVLGLVATRSGHGHAAASDWRGHASARLSGLDPGRGSNSVHCLGGWRAASTPTRVAQDGVLADADLHVDRSGLLIGACAPYDRTLVMATWADGSRTLRLMSRNQSAVRLTSDDTTAAQ